MSKVASAEERACEGTSHVRKRSPVRYGGADSKAGSYSNEKHKEKVRCASRRLPR